MISEHIKTLEALQTAIRMEKDGKQYYLKVSGASGNSIGRKLFQSLASEEDIHLLKCEEIFQAIQSNKAWPIVELNHLGSKEINTLFAEAGNKCKYIVSEIAAVQQAMEMENMTRDFYQLQAEKASFETEKIYYKTLAGEESIHHAVLLDYYEYLKNPAGWFTLKEHHSLDGS